MKTAYQLYKEAPDSQIHAAGNARRAVERGYYSEAASYLAHAATEEGDTDWARDAGLTAAWYRGPEFVAIETIALEIERDSR